MVSTVSHKRLSCFQRSVSTQFKSFRYILTVFAKCLRPVQNHFNYKHSSLNVRGINQSNKRRKQSRWLHHQRAQCCLLKETYSDEKCISSWETDWGGKVYAAHGSKHSKGVKLLMNPNFDCQVELSIKDKNGRFIILDLKADDSHLILVRI